MPGPPPEPTELKKLKGNPGKRPLNENEPQPDIADKCPEPPAYMPKYAKQEWRYQAQKLWKIGLFTKIDRGVFIAYCMAWNRFREAEDEIAAIIKGGQKNALMIQTKNGNYVHNPAVSISKGALEDLVKYAQQLGMTPSARTRISTSPKKPTTVPDAKKDDGKKTKPNFYRKG